MATYRTIPIFGGAIKAQIPASFMDVSAIRQVPDNQEVFVQEDGFASIMFDILERVESESDEGAIKYHFSDLAGEAESKVIGVERTKLESMGIPTYALRAITKQQPRSNSKGDQIDFTGIVLIMARLERQTTDIVISINIPHVRDESSEGEGGLEVEEEASLEKASEVKKKIMESFEIKDWSLFGEG